MIENHISLLKHVFLSKCVLISGGNWFIPKESILLPGSFSHLNTWLKVFFPTGISTELPGDILIATEEGEGGRDVRGSASLSFLSWILLIFIAMLGFLGG